MEVGGSAACVWEDGTSVGVHGLHVEMSWEVEAVGFMSERGEIRCWMERKRIAWREREESDRRVLSERKKSSNFLEG